MASKKEIKRKLKRKAQKKQKLNQELTRALPIVCDEFVPHNRTAIKQYFYKKYGYRCWLCGKEFDPQKLTLHHVIPFHITRHTVVEESSIVCPHCHFHVINEEEYGTPEYWALMERMYDNLKKWQQD